MTRIVSTAVCAAVLMSSSGSATNPFWDSIGSAGATGDVDEAREGDLDGMGEVGGDVALEQELALDPARAREGDPGTLVDIAADDDPGTSTGALAAFGALAVEGSVSASDPLLGPLKFCFTD